MLNKSHIVANHPAIRKLMWKNGMFIDAENGRRALEILDEENVDLVPADLNMPEMGGTDGFIC